jgi:competence protein ComEC
MRKLLVIAAILLFLASAALLFRITNQPAQARVDFLDVGQGDAMLLQAPSGQRILIDSGPNQTVLPELAHALPFWANEIDIAILSHFHEDHAGGLLSVARHYKIKRLIIDRQQAADQKNGDLLAALRDEGVELAALTGRQEIELGPGCGLSLVASSQPEADENYSLISKFDCLGKSWLFLGDAPQAEQERLRQELPEWRAETVKISHHGSDDGLSEAWLEQLGTETAVIEVGQGNKFRHPSRRVLKKLERLGLSVRRTDLDGRISFAYGQ